MKNNIVIIIIILMPMLEPVGSTDVNFYISGPQGIIDPYPASKKSGPASVLMIPGWMIFMISPSVVISSFRISRNFHR
jgi:hypothetical protein